MSKYQFTDIEPMIVKARKQKQLMDELLGDLERKGRFDYEDILYVDTVLKNIVVNLKSIRKDCGKHRRFPAHLLALGGEGSAIR